MDFNDIFKFDEIANDNDNDISNNDLDEKSKIKDEPDSSLININDNKNTENTSEKINITSKEQYELNNEANMILDIQNLPINPESDSLSKLSFNGIPINNTTLLNTSKKAQDLYETEALKTEPNNLYPQLYQNEEYPIIPDQDAFAEYMNYPTNFDINSNPYLFYYNNTFNQDENLPYNQNELINYNTDFDVNGFNPYYPFPTDIDMEDLGMDGYSLTTTSASANDDSYKQVLAMTKENNIDNVLTIPTVNKNDTIENKKSKNINMNSLNSNPLSSISLQKSLNTEKSLFNTNSLIIPSTTEDETMIDDDFKYIYPINNRNKILNENLKNDINFEDLISLDNITQQMNITDNSMKKNLLNGNINPLTNLENIGINNYDIIQQLYPSSVPIDKLKPKTETNSLKTDLLDNIKDMNNLMEFDFSSLDNIMDEDLVKIKSTTLMNDSKAINVTQPQLPEDLSLLFTNSEPVLSSENQNITPLNIMDDYKNIANSLNSQNKDYSDNLLKMFITSPKLNASKNLIKNKNKTIKSHSLDNLSTKFLDEKSMVGSPSINIPTTIPIIPDLLNETKEENGSLTRSSSMPKLSFSSLAKSTAPSTKLINKSKPSLKSHPLLSNIKNPIQKKSPILSKSKSNLLAKELSNSNLLQTKPILPITTTTSSSLQKSLSLTKSSSIPITTTIATLSSTPKLPLTSNTTTTTTTSTTATTTTTSSSTTSVKPSVLPKSSTFPDLSALPTLASNHPPPSIINKTASITSSITSDVIKSKSSTPIKPLTTTKSKVTSTPLLTTSTITTSSIPTTTITTTTTTSSSAAAATITKSTVKPILPLKPSSTTTSSLLASIKPTSSIPSSNSTSTSVPSLTDKTLTDKTISNTVSVPATTKSITTTVTSTPTSSTSSSATTTVTTTTSTSVSTTTPATKIIPKPIAPLTTLPLNTAIPPLPLPTNLNPKNNINVPPVLPPLLSNPKLFPFLFATDSTNLMSNAAKSVAEKLAKSSLSATTSTTTPATSTTSTASTASSIASTTTTTTTSTPTIVPNPTNPSANVLSSALAALSTLPVTTPILPTPLASKAMLSSTNNPVLDAIKKESNDDSKSNVSSPASSPHLTSASSASTTSSSAPSTAAVSTNTKSNKNLNKNNAYVDEKRRKFLERNRIAASKCRQKKKAWVQDLEKKSTEVSITNRNLKIIVNQLREQVAVLRSQLLLHKNCPSKVIQQYLLQQSSINLSLQNTLQSLNQNSIGNSSLLNINKIQ